MVKYDINTLNKGGNGMGIDIISVFNPSDSEDEDNNKTDNKLK